MSKYQQKKEAVRMAVIEWQNELEYQCYSYGELAEWEDYFAALAKRYGLTREFRENGII